MKNSHRSLLLLLVTGLLILAGCSKPDGEGQKQASPASPVATSPPAVSAPVEPTAPELKKESPRPEKQKAEPAVQKSPAKKQPAAISLPTAITKEVPSPIAPPSIPEPTPAPSPIVQPPVVELPTLAAHNPPAAIVPSVKRVTIAANTTIAIRTIDSVDSRTDQAGQTFRASIDSDVVIDEDIVIRRGADAYLKLAQVSSAGDLRGKSELQLQLERIVIGKKSYDIESSTIERSTAPEGPKTTRDIGIGAAIGAAIGAIAGGGKGAAIGAAAGAGAGAVAAAITKGEQVLVRSETRLEFRLEQPLEVEFVPASSSTAPEVNGSSGPKRLGENPAVPARPRTPDHRKISNVSGEWQLSIDGPEHTRHLTLWLRQDGENLHGEISDTFRGESMLGGRVIGDSITFSTKSRVGERIVESKYTGKIEGDHLSGTLTIRMTDGYWGRLPRRGPRISERTVYWRAERLQP